MKVILLTDVSKIGKRYEIKNVSDGYGLNYLIPNKLAEVATADKVAKIEALKKANSAKDAAAHAAIMAAVIEVDGKTVTIKAKANEKGNLYERVAIPAIIKAVREQLNVTLPDYCITLADPIRSAGETVVPVSLDAKKSSLTVVVVTA